MVARENNSLRLFSVQGKFPVFEESFDSAEVFLHVFLREAVLCRGGKYGSVVRVERNLTRMSKRNIIDVEVKKYRPKDGSLWDACSNGLRV